MMMAVCDAIRVGLSGDASLAADTLLSEFASWSEAFTA